MAVDPAAQPTDSLPEEGLTLEVWAENERLTLERLVRDWCDWAERSPRKYTPRVLADDVLRHVARICDDLACSGQGAQVCADAIRALMTGYHPSEFPMAGRGRKACDAR